MEWSASIAEQRIREAARSGSFDDLPGKGKPLPRDDLEGVPDELRIGYRILKNAGALPPELELRKEMVSLEQLILACDDEAGKRTYRERLAPIKLKYQSLMKIRGWSGAEAFESYREQLENKLTK
ncbi:DnaJ family domain-containing protein [Cohnella fermenti]|uniref:DUF1992 domain-containing protein n=1 Tax=Cohnella fermenti TaxID=2565925 RepID=A0A4S4BKS9_9BACL|nr:DUF1992 domain-containing protein [Cohnella fermenti]THF75131.1 DUF1992 domain-containing protein [Cohnella fermenti]